MFRERNWKKKKSLLYSTFLPIGNFIQDTILKIMGPDIYPKFPFQTGGNYKAFALWSTQRGQAYSLSWDKQLLLVALSDRSKLNWRQVGLVYTLNTFLSQALPLSPLPAWDEILEMLL